MESIINAIKRLERAGAENSRTTAKLRQAAINAATEIQKQVPEKAILPRGYMVVRRKSNIGSECYLKNSRGEYVDSTPGGSYLHGDFNAWIEGTSRETVLQFASDVAQGLLTEIATWLEERAKENLTNAATLENISQ